MLILINDKDMNLYIDPSEIKSLQFVDNFLWDTLIITFKDGSRQKIRKYVDVGWELWDEYKKLYNQLNNN